MLDSLWSQTGKIISEFQERVQALPVNNQPTASEIRTHLDESYRFDKPLALSSVIPDVDEMLRNWSVHVTHPRYFGLFNPGVTQASIIADALTATYNPQLAAWSHAPAACEIERHVLSVIAEMFGFDPNTTFANFTTGGLEANQSAVIAALTRLFPSFGDRGLRALSAQPLFYVSQEAHDSFAKIAHMSGIGRAALRVIPTDQSLKISLTALEEQYAIDIKNGDAPFMVVGTTGTTSSGTIDPLSDLADFCRAKKLWYHVDAAWGGAAVISPKLRPFLNGIEQADSITCDAHKWFSVSMGAGMFFCKHADTLAEAFRVSASYMPAKIADTHDPYVTTIQWSRRFIGLKLFMSLAELGVDGYQAQIEQQTELGDHLRQLLTESGWTILNDTPLPVVCFTHAQLRDPSALLGKLSEQGEVWISVTLLHKKIPALRACITSFRSTAADVEFLVQRLNQALQRS